MLVAPPEYRLFPYPADYAELSRLMEARADAVAKGEAPEALWAAEFPPLYTAGTGANPEHELLEPQRFPVHVTGRGGKMTYHGPGQRVSYVMLNLDARDMKDLRLYVHLLEEWLILTLSAFGVQGRRSEGRTGVWVKDESAIDGEAKIAAIGVRVRKWVTFHGTALNVNPDLSHFEGVVPCGLQGARAASLASQGVPVAMEDVDRAAREAFCRVFSCLPFAEV